MVLVAVDSWREDCSDGSSTIFFAAEVVDLLAPFSLLSVAMATVGVVSGGGCESLGADWELVTTCLLLLEALV